VQRLPASPTGVSVPQAPLDHRCHVSSVEDAEGAAQNIGSPVDESVPIFIQSLHDPPMVSADATGAAQTENARARAVITKKPEHRKPPGDCSREESKRDRDPPGLETRCDKGCNLLGRADDQ
jgi:hypothetical protein